MKDPKIHRINTDVVVPASAENTPPQHREPTLKDDIEFVRRSVGLDLTALLDPRASVAKLAPRMLARIKSTKDALQTRSAPDKELMNSIERLKRHVEAARNAGDDQGGAQRHRHPHRRHPRHRPALAGAR